MNPIHPANPPRPQQPTQTQHTKETSQHYFKEDIKVYGVKTAVVGKIAKKYWTTSQNATQARNLSSLCEELYKSGYMEEAFIVSNWMPEYIKHLEATDPGKFSNTG